MIHPPSRRVQTRRTVPNLAISLVVPLVTRASPVQPTAADFAALANATALYLQNEVLAQLPDDVDLLSYRFVVESAEYGAGIPEPRFNVRLVYDFFDYIFLTLVEDVQDVPIAAEINEVLLASIRDDEYLNQVVRAIPAFASATEVYVESIDTTFVPLPTPSPSPSPSPIQAQSQSPSPSPLPVSTPSAEPTASVPPSAGSGFDTTTTVRASNFFIAYDVPEASAVTDQDLETLVDETMEWFIEIVSAMLPEGVALENITPRVGETAFDDAAPDDQPNVFTEYSYIDFTYRITIEGQVPPTPDTTLEILRDGMNDEYLERIREIDAFASARAAFLVDLSTASITPTTTPMPSSTVSPTEAPVPTAPFQTIRVPDFYIAYVAEQSPVVVTTEQFDEQVRVTNLYFEDFLKVMFADQTDITFLRAESSLESTLIDSAIPEERFNIYMQYEYTDLIYTADSNPPDVEASFEILKNSMSVEYLLRYARNVTGAFATVNEAVMRAVDEP